VQILAASASLPSPFYAPFVARLADTAREDIADCAAASYKSLSLAAAQKLFMLNSKEELLRFLRERRPDFVVSGDNLFFGESGIAGVEKTKAELDPLGLLGTTLEYAADLERIV
jgi:CSN8/PSMD8/EIF3K family